jgi:hypothetical protein
VTGEDHLEDTGVEGTVLMTEGKAKDEFVPVKDMKAV